jgi:hypothetical protein
MKRAGWVEAPRLSTIGLRLSACRVMVREDDAEWFCANSGEKISALLSTRLGECHAEQLDFYVERDGSIVIESSGGGVAQLVLGPSPPVRRG